MRAWLRSRLTYANVIATIALFVALGGSSYAAIKITGRNVPKDALTGADIKNLTGRDVRNNSLTGADVKNLKSADVKNGGLLAEDFAPGQLPRGEQGPPGIPPNQTLELSGLTATGDQNLTSQACVDLDHPSLGSVLIDLPLPAGAHITEVRARYRDTSTRDIQFGLEYTNFDGTSDHQVVAVGGSSNSPAEGFSTVQPDPGAVLPPVSDTVYYYLYANPGTTGTGELWFCGVSVDYTLG